MSKREFLKCKKKSCARKEIFCGTGTIPFSNFLWAEFSGQRHETRSKKTRAELRNFFFSFSLGWDHRQRHHACPNRRDWFWRCFSEFAENRLEKIPLTFFSIRAEISFIPFRVASFFAATNFVLFFCAEVRERFKADVMCCARVNWGQISNVMRNLLRSFISLADIAARASRQSYFHVNCFACYDDGVGVGRNFYSLVFKQQFLNPPR